MTLAASEVLARYGHLYGRVPGARAIGYPKLSSVVEPPEAPNAFDPLNGANPFRMLGNGPDPTLTIQTPNGLGAPVGDCGWVMCNNANVVTGAATDVEYTQPTSNVIVTDYLAYDHGHDIGVSNPQLIPYWHTVGMFGSKIQGYGSIAEDFDEAIAYAYALYGVLTGIVVTEGMEEATAHGEPWDYDPSDTNVLGGHDVLVFGRLDRDTGVLATWGQRQAFTRRWFEHLVEERDGVVTNELIVAKPGLVDVPKLDSYLNGIAA